MGGSDVEARVSAWLVSTTMQVRRRRHRLASVDSLTTAPPCSSTQSTGAEGRLGRRASGGAR